MLFKCQRCWLQNHFQKSITLVLQFKKKKKQNLLYTWKVTEPAPKSHPIFCFEIKKMPVIQRATDLLHFLMFHRDERRSRNKSQTLPAFEKASWLWEKAAHSSEKPHRKHLICTCLWPCFSEGANNPNFLFTLQLLMILRHGLQLKLQTPIINCELYIFRDVINRVGVW